MTSGFTSAATLYIVPELMDADSAEVRGDAYRHLFRARRLALEDRLRVVDGCGRARQGRIIQIERDRAVVELGAALTSRESPRELSLIVAVPRPERASWLVEKATELGVWRIAWIACQRSSRRLSSAAGSRHGRVAIAALEQCGGARLPLISGTHGWEEVPALLEPLGDRLLLDPQGERGPAPPIAADRVGLVIGPEGGFTEDERESLVALGCRPWTLGRRILRVETAAVAGAALLLTPA